MAAFFRAKNPPESFPYCTLGIIALNVLVFLCTINGDFRVRVGIAENLGLSYDNANIFRVFSSMFVHENILHIGGNMLFLWIFGASVEGRLRAWKYLAVYAGAGVVGGLLQVLIDGNISPQIVYIGASGAIMGLLGAYLFMFPFSKICVAFWEVQAMWFIGFYILINVLSLGSGDGIAHVSHLAGFALGYLIAFLFRPHTDSESHSEVKSMLDEVKDPRVLVMTELEILLTAPQTDSKVLMAYCHRAQMDGGSQWAHYMVDAMQRHQNLLVDDADPREVAAMLLSLGPDDPNLLPLIYLRIGSKLEKIAEHDLACHLYRRVYDMNTLGRDSETALYRLGRLFETRYDNPEAALDTYSELLRLFPAGSLTPDAQAAVVRLRTKMDTENRQAVDASAPGARRAIELDIPVSAQQTSAPAVSAPNPQRAIGVAPLPGQTQAADQPNRITLGNGRCVEF